MSWKVCERNRSRPNLRNYTDICLEVLRKTTKDFCQDIRSPGRDLNPGPPEYEAGMLTTWPRHSIPPHIMSGKVGNMFLNIPQKSKAGPMGGARWLWAGSSISALFYSGGYNRGRLWSLYFIPSLRVTRLQNWLYNYLNYWIHTCRFGVITLYASFSEEKLFFWHYNVRVFAQTNNVWVVWLICT
jgi:hypothetical protein